MTISRYNRAAFSSYNGKRLKSSSQACKTIRNMVDSGQLSVSEYMLSHGQRLDLVSANFYGSAHYWWVIAAASGIGWQCQVPPGTLLKIPTSLQKVLEAVG